MKKFFFTLPYIIPKYIQTIFMGKDIKIITDVNFFYNLIVFLKKNLFCKYLILVDIAVVDLNTIFNRFEINYIFLSVKYNKRVIITYTVDENMPLNSISHLFSAAG